MALLRTAAGMPICASCAAWSCMRAISGETTMAVRPSTQRGQLIAERFSAAGGHDDADVVSGKQAAHDAFLRGRKLS